MKPFLREKVPVNFEEIPDTTSFEAGYLVTKNAGWRNVRPVIDRYIKMYRVFELLPLLPRWSDIQKRR